jgi:hypothetical protein
MPTGPKGEKRPADFIGNAVKVMRIATGEEAEDLSTPPAKPPGLQIATRAAICGTPLCRRR